MGFRLKIRYNNIEFCGSSMGETCSMPQMENQPQPQLKMIRPYIPVAPLQQIDPQNESTTSQYLVNRTNYVKKCNENLNVMVKSRLSQLSDLPQFKKSRFQYSKRIYLEAIKGTYIGQYENGTPKGFGAIEYDNGDYLEGQFIDGRCEGRGRYIKKNGSYFEGDLRNNVADGYGKYYDRTGYKYEGQWKNNMPNGKGEAVYVDGSRYNGQFLNNRRHGKGVLMQKGTVFEGTFVRNKLEGQGTMENEKGQRYQGSWLSNLKHGQGEYSWPNGNVYKGEYKNGLRDGFGVMTYQNGQSYEGQWMKGDKHGDGIYRGHRRDIVGVWRIGELVKEK